MRSIFVNGEDAGVRVEGLSTMADLIELLKNSIDPDHMITSIHIDGHELEESDWGANLNKFETSILEIETGVPDEYAHRKLSEAANVVKKCYVDFRESRKCFQGGDMTAGNQNLVQAVNTLQAFFQWYVTMVELLPEEERRAYKINDNVEEICEVCKRICQQQLYQSWWALGETIKTDLEPKLDKLEDFCREFASQV